MTQKIKNQGFAKISSVIPSKAKEYKLDGVLQKHQIFQLWEKVFLGFAPDAKGQTKAIDFQSGKLTIACLSKEIAYQIKILTDRIMRELNNMLGRNLVYVINVEC